jgi:UDP-2,3-diacylglucosamine pyrophosphatase LpxH
MYKSKTTDVQSVRCEVDDKKLWAVPIGDVHLGHPTCDVKKFLETIEFVKKNGYKVILMGDLLECANKGSIGAGWVEQLASPQQQYDTLCEVLTPIKDQIIVLLTGNHEVRAWRDTGVDLSKMMARHLGVPYGGYAAMIYFRVGKQNYVCHAQHGSSGAKYNHTKIQAAKRTATHTEADIYLYGHTHALMADSEEKRYYDKRAKTVKIRKQYTVLTGSFLSYEGSYAQMKNYNPTRKGVANIYLGGEKWDIHCST